MYENAILSTSSNDNDNTFQPRNENEAQLLSTEREAVLSWKGRQMIHFFSPVKVNGEEILDWMNKGVLMELISLENAPERNGVPIMAREMAPSYFMGHYPLQEISNRSLLLNPQWFSVYFISDFKPFFPEAENPGLREIYDKLWMLFEPRKAIIDYQNHKIYLSSLRELPAA